MTYTSEQVRLGGSLITIYKAISYYDIDDPAFDEYEPVIIAGKTIELLSSIRALGKIESHKYEIYRKLARLKPTHANDVLRRLEKNGVTNIEWEKASEPETVKTITAITTSKANVLGAAAELYISYQPPERPRAAISALEASLHLPIPEARLKAQLVAQGLSVGAVSNAIDMLVSIELLAKTLETEGGEPLLYNPYAFGENIKDAYTALKALPPNKQEHAIELLHHVRSRPGMPFPSNSDRAVITLLAKTGIIDLSGIQLSSGPTAKEFPTAPDIWGVFARPNGGISTDLIDDAKLLLNSLRYGEIFSPYGRGRIIDPSVLISALIQRGQVGPATAIGEDYPLPLARGIVNITESRLHPGRFYMELRKTDVAESVRDVLNQNAILPAGDIIAPEVMQSASGTFQPPEHVRRQRKLPSDLIEARDKLAFELRTHRKRI